jgi:hypothetical protein
MIIHILPVNILFASDVDNSMFAAIKSLTKGYFSLLSTGYVDKVCHLWITPQKHDLKPFSL